VPFAPAFSPKEKKKTGLNFITMRASLGFLLLLLASPGLCADQEIKLGEPVSFICNTSNAYTQPSTGCPHRIGPGGIANWGGQYRGGQHFITVRDKACGSKQCVCGSSSDILLRLTVEVNFTAMLYLGPKRTGTPPPLGIYHTFAQAQLQADRHLGNGGTSLDSDFTFFSTPMTYGNCTSNPTPCQQIGSVPSNCLRYPGCSWKSGNPGVCIGTYNRGGCPASGIIEQTFYTNARRRMYIVLGNGGTTIAASNVPSILVDNVSYKVVVQQA
jgi:hypothetical protein